MVIYLQNRVRMTVIHTGHEIAWVINATHSRSKDLHNKHQWIFKVQVVKFNIIISACQHIFSCSVQSKEMQSERDHLKHLHISQQ